jgi:hypothetical protein
MAGDPLEYAAAYISPLTDREHARIGRIAILWGQIEYCVDEMIEYVSDLRWNELAALGVTERTLANKVNFLLQIRHRHPNPDYQRRIVEFCSLLHETKTARNHLFHGMWGWRADKRTREMLPAARKASSLDQPFKYTRLPALEKKLCKCSRMALDLCQPVWKSTVRARLNRFVHHNVAEADEQWMTQWSERNPLDGEHLDRSAKAGQLPRLRVLFPRK